MNVKKLNLTISFSAICYYDETIESLFNTLSTPKVFQTHITVIFVRVKSLVVCSDTSLPPDEKVYVFASLICLLPNRMSYLFLKEIYVTGCQL